METYFTLDDVAHTLATPTNVIPPERPSVLDTVIGGPNAPYRLEKTNSELDRVAIRFDAGKTDWSLLPFEAIEPIVKVLEFGAKKYARHNWQRGDGFKYSRIINSLLRHMFAYMRGEDNDPESGLSHLAHVGCNIVFLLYYDKYKERYKNDDRREV